MECSIYAGLNSTLSVVLKEVIRVRYSVYSSTKIVTEDAAHAEAARAEGAINAHIKECDICKAANRTFVDTTLGHR
jgi:hypothetical protein